jgi:fucose 4-O-acetylase-like acetyltransferase
MDLNLRRYDSLLICTGQAVAGIYLTFTLAWLIDRGGWLAPALAGVGSASLVVLLFHEAIQNETYVRLRTLLPVWPWIPALLAFGVAVGVSLLLWHQARRQRWLGRLLLPWHVSSPPVHKLPS